MQSIFRRQGSCTRIVTVGGVLEERESGACGAVHTRTHAVRRHQAVVLPCKWERRLVTGLYR